MIGVTSRLPVPVAVGVLAVSLCLCLNVAGCAATTAGTATPAPPVPAATADTLPALLLSAGEVGAALGAEVVATREVSEPWNDAVSRAALSGTDDDGGCLPVVGAAQRTVYDGTGWTAVRGQVLREPPTAPGWAHFAAQSVVLFGDRGAAADFFGRSVRSWSGCADRELTTAGQLAPEQVWSIGPVSTDGDLLTVSRTQRSPMQWFCQRALSVRGTVVIDLEACSADGPTQAAAAMARTIGERLPAP